MTRRLFIDLTKCDECEKCSVECGYFYRPSAVDHGILGVRELATFALVCRRCKEPACVASCKFDALERQDDGVLKRFNLRCMSCKCCSQACPFGTIYPETTPLYASNCDFCVSSDSEPPCIPSCEKGAIEFREVEESVEDGIFVIGDSLAAKAPKWTREEV